MKNTTAPMTKFKIKVFAQREAMGTIFSHMGDYDYERVMSDDDCLEDDELILWEPFERWGNDLEQVREYLSGLADQFERFGLAVAGIK